MTLGGGGLGPRLTLTAGTKLWVVSHDAKERRGGGGGGGGEEQATGGGSVVSIIMTLILPTIAWMSPLRKNSVDL